MNNLFKNAKTGDLFKDSRETILVYCCPNANHHVLSTYGKVLEAFYSNGKRCDYKLSKVKIIEKLI